MCRTCRRPQVVCYCQHVTKLHTKNRVVILQHPRESEVPINTARIAALCLPEARLQVGVRWNDAAALDDPEYPAALLYPGPGAIDVEANPPKGLITLVVVDGTWWQAKKLVNSNPRIAALPRYAFRPDAPSNYRIRKEPDADYVSTIEAMAHVLGVLEGDPARFLAMIRPFEAMVDSQLSFSQRQIRPRHIAKPKPKKTPWDRVPALLRNPAYDLVCVHGEANAWPYGSLERTTGHAELVQWVACRPSTGETFEAFVAPKLLSPSTPRHVGVDEAILKAGGRHEDLVRRWAEFARPNDLVGSWGTYATGLFGAVQKPHVDLRSAAKLFAGTPIGTMESFVERFRLGEHESLASGRAGRRLAHLVAVARELTKRPG